MIQAKNFTEAREMTALSLSAGRGALALMLLYHRRRRSMSWKLLGPRSAARA